MACWAGRAAGRLASSGEPTDDRPSGAGIWGIPAKTSFWRDAQFDTIRLALIKVAARVTEMKTRIKVALPTCHPHQASWALLAARAVKLPP